MEESARKQVSSANDRRQSEKARREAAQRDRGGVIAGSGVARPPRVVPQMVSVRLDPDLLAELRTLAQIRESTVSDLLREAARLLVAAQTQRALFVSYSRIETGSMAAGTLVPDWDWVTSAELVEQRSDVGAKGSNVVVRSG